MKPAAAFWTPTEAQRAGSQLSAFTTHLEQATGRSFADYSAFHAFSIREAETFWRALLEWTGISWSGSSEPVILGSDVRTARFFPNVRLSYTANLLAPGRDGETAIRSVCEGDEATEWTRRALRVAVGRVARRLRDLGIEPGDRVAALATNTPETVIAALAATGIGATWSSAAPDMADEAIFDRFGQLGAKVLFAHGSYRSGGVDRPITERVAGLARRLPTLRALVHLGGEHLDALDIPTPSLQRWIDDDQVDPVTEWPEFPFDHPLFILFTSGTTGAPKCIVHGAGGTLLEHVKEHRLHTDLRDDDVLFFQTSTGWMMWNWLVSGLASGASIALYDGSVSIPEKDALLRAVERLRATVLGTSAAYIQYLEDAGVTPLESADLSRVRLVQSTGSILQDRQYAWLRENLGAIPVHSISGGTDIIGCFVMGAPTLPVHVGESPCRTLGYDVRVMTPDGMRSSGHGELVCASPFPSRPTGLLDDLDGSRFSAAYFDQHPGVWTHGDIIEIHERGSVRMLGRSDGILNIRGVRIGPAELYRIVLELDEVIGAMALAQRQPDDREDRLVMFVVLAEGTQLDRPLMHRIKRSLRDRASAVHVPAVVAQVTDLPRTHSGKQSERAGWHALHGLVPDNLAALANPECLPELGNHPLVQCQ